LFLLAHVIAYNSIQIWVIEDNKRVPVPENLHGQFFGGDCYILLYTYLRNRTEEHIIYFWLGNTSTPDEKGAAALLTVALDDSMGGRPVQVRVTQGKEPAHFRQLFKGRTIIYKGGRSKGDGGAGAKLDDIALFHIRGTNASNVVAVQVAAEASSLNSTDTFVLVTNEHAYAWAGHSANSDELTTAEAIGARLTGTYNGKGGRSLVNLREGEEPEDFWSALGGKGPYASEGQGENAPRDPRLFSASTATGSFKVEEVDQFDQTDLNDEDVYLLDTFTTLFLWVGSQASTTEKEKAMEFAQRFVVEACDGRDPDIPIIRVTAGQEPTMFSSHFHAWDPEFTKRNVFVDPYQAKLDAIAAEKAKRQEATPSLIPAQKAASTPVSSKAVSGSAVAVSVPAAKVASSPAPVPANIAKVILSVMN
jgi:advillin